MEESLYSALQKIIRKFTELLPYFARKSLANLADFPVSWTVGTVYLLPFTKSISKFCVFLKILYNSET